MKFLLLPLFIFISTFTYCQSFNEGYYPHFIATNKFDTQQVRILYDSISSNINGWVVRQWNDYYAGIDPGFCMGCTYPSSKWIDTDILLYADKKTIVNPEKIWKYKLKTWK